MKYPILCWLQKNRLILSTNLQHVFVGSCTASIIWLCSCGLTKSKSPMTIERLISVYEPFFLVTINYSINYIINCILNYIVNHY